MPARSVSIPADSLLQHASFVRALARDLLADEHLAEDIAQEAWLRYVARPPRSDPRNWLAVVVRNLARNAWRSQRTREVIEERAARPEVLGALDDDIAQAAALRSVVEAVLALDEPYRSTVIARYYRDEEPARIARESGVPVATVKSRLQRAHAQLRERLDRELGARANWALALGKLACFGESGAAGGSVTVLATTAKLAGIAAALALTLFVAWRMLRVEPAPPLADLVASTTLEQEPFDETAAPHSTSGERRELSAPAPVPSATFRVAGTVRDLPYEPLALEGGPARDVEFTLVLTDSPNPGGAALGRATLRSDANGAFAAELPNPAQRPLWITLYAAKTQERRRIWSQTKVETAVDAQAEIELARPAHGLLEGIIVDSNYAPIPHAHVRLVADELRAEVAADEQGCLSVPWNDWLHSVVPLDLGASVLSWDAPKQLDAGGWAGLRVVIGRSATLRVRAVDAHGGGVAGVQVTVLLDESERRQLGSSDEWETPRHFGKTDASGVLELPAVWADRKLSVRVASGNESLDAASARGDELVFADHGDGAPIVLAPGEQRELVAHWNGDLRVVGRTLSASGAPVPDVLVQVWRGNDQGSNATLLAYVRSASDGTFEARVRTLLVDAGLRIVAGERASKAAQLGGIGYIGAGAPTDGAVGEATVDTARAVDGVVRVDVTLHPTLTIAGRVLDGEGRPKTRDGLGGVRLWAVPAGASSARNESRDVGGAGAKLENDGRFLVFGLGPGAWDVYAAEQIQSFYTWDSFVHRFASIAAGTQGVELRLVRQGEVKIRVRIHGGEPDDVTVLHGELYPVDSLLERRPAPRELRVDGAASWPVDAVLGFGGISGGRDELGSWSYGFYSTDETREHALPPIGPGWYVIGIHPSSKSGQFWFPQATQPRWFEPGEYALDFELVQTTELAGRIVGDVRTERLGVELRLPSGARVPLESLPGFGTPRYALETDAHGRFVVRHAPVGRFALRAGSLAELERGEFRREVTVDLVAGASSTVELTLP